MRCNDGSVFDNVTNNCADISAKVAGDWIYGPDGMFAKANFAVDHSRQVFFLSVAYHMTGKANYIRLARHGLMSCNIETGLQRALGDILGP